MNKDQVKGSAKTLTGKAKQAAAHVTGNPRLRAAGRSDQAAGKIQQTVGDIKQTAKRAIAAGATVLVAGTAVFQGGPSRYAANIAALRG